MSRSLIAVRPATQTDAGFLTTLWCDALRRAEHHEHVADLEQVVKTAEASPEQRLLVAEYDGEPAGAVLLRIGTVTALNLELAVHVVSPTVAPAFRRHGVGRTLMECAAAFAEDAGVPHVCVGVASGSRDANRFMARLALGQVGTFRVAPTAAVRARIAAQRPTRASSSGAGGRQLTRVLAARRSARRADVPGPAEVPSEPPPTA
ncbi:GNAT family N-acetyltransferase [Nocardioides sp. 1609]|uniref:GNAT family N-acetyltransferase n=1 Tax=Nocardioides sp. 1609 TaxID=2508327 RepID=UPI001FD638BE